MLLVPMEGIALLYYWTWFIWPFIFVFSFAFGLAEIIKNENASKKNIWIAAISLLIILAGIVAPALEII